jgi:hypothetical protein
MAASDRIRSQVQNPIFQQFPPYLEPACGSVQTRVSAVTVAELRRGIRTVADAWSPRFSGPEGVHDFRSRYSTFRVISPG